MYPASTQRPALRGFPRHVQSESILFQALFLEVQDLSGKSWPGPQKSN